MATARTASNKWVSRCQEIYVHMSIQPLIKQNSGCIVHFVTNRKSPFSTVSWKASYSTALRENLSYGRKRCSFVSFESFGPFVRGKQWRAHHQVSCSQSAAFSEKLTSIKCFSTNNMTASDGKKTHRAFIALGSNMGDCIVNIEEACLHMERSGIKIKRTSSLFETAPMYVLEQQPFINGACEVETSLDPIQLLDALQCIEKALGRQKTVDKGPRVIDLDILLYDKEIIDTPRLTVPHKLMMERDFVLRPLCQLIPNEAPPSNNAVTFLSQLKSLPAPVPYPVTTVPLAPHLAPLTPSKPSRNTHVMAILNVTPDSFSDGGKYSADNLAHITETVQKFIASGATILDIGGESTRPGAQSIDAEEELSRVIPVIEHIRGCIPEAKNVAISIDTYRARVAEQACTAGADIINDISGGSLDKGMLDVMARTGKTVILMHMRGTPNTMKNLISYPNGVINDVRAELLRTVEAAERAGIRRWRIILDPGLGFAKNKPQNLSLLKDLPCPGSPAPAIGPDRVRDITTDIRNNNISSSATLDSFPWLVGPSRKSFIGDITGKKNPGDRIFGTAAAVTASIAAGADIVRVHDVEEMSQVVKVADAIYRAEM